MKEGPSASEQSTCEILRQLNKQNKGFSYGDKFSLVQFGFSILTSCLLQDSNG